MKETIYDYDDLLEMLDSLLREPTEFWDNFYSDRNKGIPFFTDVPDENLVSYFKNNILKPGNVLELGCGPGRNAIYFAQRGCTVDAVDLSRESIKWAEERANEKNVSINFMNENIFDLDIEEGKYDIVYDAGCFHHIAPHRRMSYIDLVNRALKPNGYFAITCFVEGGQFGGAEISDWEVYRSRSLMGGLGYTEEKLRLIFRDFKEVEIRKMKVIEQPNDTFGVPDFLTALFLKN
ncbi:class I SAM-dependent methyltransferase [Ureibacillus manganicus]|uniref:Methyltransferase n=1 Tax=Ureibacillus manganicus DSM 26584 TaxID=1384049 RepID=A0A0A3HP91_9BACL|nr:class I SAM-dependent methyltransferase [Ureibacillus manganicus]KGR74351.1 methyltransferase [Ureibacillus manganicus DSM 26584]